MRYGGLAALIAVFLLATVGPLMAAQAASGAWAINDHGRLRLLSGGETTAAPGSTASKPAEGEVLLGLQFQLEPGWKIYWRSPGDAGFPPSIDWSASSNLAEASIEWPVPHRFSLFGLETFGYENEVVLPIVARLRENGRELTLNAKVDYLICSDICIPYSENVALDLPSGGPKPTSDLAIIDYYRAQVPLPIMDSDINLLAAHLQGPLQAPELLVRVASSVPFVSPDLLVEGPPDIYFGKPEIAISGDGAETTFRVPVGVSESGGVVEGKRLVLTITDGTRGAEAIQVARFQDPDAIMSEAMVGRTSDAHLVTILGLALLGGLILNLMPCVLPVLSLKLLSVIKHGGRSRAAIRTGFLASAAGIIFSFLLLATAASAVKGAGLAVGWGIQFQQPAFLIFMALMITAFAANLFGLFEIPLPASMATRLAETGGQGLAGSFVTGAFATLLATPCSAPFLGTAVGFALARGVFEIYLVFAFLGIGLALPYLLVAALPNLARRLPKPGPWVAVLRRLLGVALIATALWLLTVLVTQIGILATALAGAALLLLWIVFWAGHRFAAAFAGGARAMATLAVVAVAFVLPLALAAPNGTPGKGEAGWAHLDIPVIQRHVAEGYTVFVDVTADWCITCQVNKRLVLDDPVVAERLAAPGTHLQRGDWTLPSDEIAAYLAAFDRYGIPFNAVYGPAAPDGILLPEILTIESVLNAIDEANAAAVN